MKKFMILLLSIATLAFAKPYVKYEHDKIFSETNGKKSLNLNYISQAVNEIFSFAGDYPLKFENENDKKIAQNDLAVLLKVMEFIQAEIYPKMDEKNRFGVDFNSALLFVCAHNFDMPNYAKKADEKFTKLINQIPNNAEIHKIFGQFLASSAANQSRMKMAKSELEKAVSLGDKSANFALSLAFLILNDQKNALKSLEEYLKFYPNDKNAKEILKAIKNGKIEIPNLAK